MRSDAGPPEPSPFEEVVVRDGRARALVRGAHARELCEGHFPGEPIVPGASLAGLMADLAALLVRGAAAAPGDDRGPDLRLTRIASCAFVSRVAPDQPIEIEARLAAAPRDGARLLVESQVRVRGACAARATLEFGACA